MSWSYDLLDGEELALLRRLSVFAGGFTLEAAEQVCSADPLDAYRVLDLLARLVDRSVVQVRRSNAEEGGDPPPPCGILRRLGAGRA